MPKINIWNDEPTTAHQHVPAEDAMRQIRVIERALFGLAEGTDGIDEDALRSEIVDAAILLADARAALEQEGR
jgi:hypothetical protein